MAMRSHDCRSGSLEFLSKSEPPNSPDPEYLKAFLITLDPLTKGPLALSMKS